MSTRAIREAHERMLAQLTVRTHEHRPVPTQAKLSKGCAQSDIPADPLRTLQVLGDVIRSARAFSEEEKKWLLQGIDAKLARPEISIDAAWRLHNLREVRALAVQRLVRVIGTHIPGIPAKRARRLREVLVGAEPAPAKAAAALERLKAYGDPPTSTRHLQRILKGPSPE